MSEDSCIEASIDVEELFALKQASDTWLTWTVNHGHNSLFHCKASDIAHAVELCRDAFPGTLIVAALLDSSKVFALNVDDGEEWNPTREFSTSISDLRGITDTVHVDAGFADGRTDDVVTLMVEINRLAGSEGRGKLHLQFVEDGLAVSIQKRGGDYIFGLEAKISVSAGTLSNEVRGLNMH